MTNEEFLKDVCPNHTEKSKWNRSELLHILEMHKKAITVTRCCKSDSEQLPSFLYKSDGGLYFKHRGDTDIADQWNEYLKTR